MRLRYLTLFLLIIIVSCYSDRIIKTESNYDYYSLSSYISSRKDSLSLDISITANRKDKIYRIEGYDTLMGKKRFILIIDKNKWILVDEKEQVNQIDFNDEIFKILPSPLIFDYTSFLEGKFPYFINPDRVEENKNTKTYYKGNNKQIVYFLDEKVKYFEIYNKEKKIFKFEYKGYIEIKNREESLIFPKILYIYDYENQKKIEWWFGEVNFN